MSTYRHYGHILASVQTAWPHTDNMAIYRHHGHIQASVQTTLPQTGSMAIYRHHDHIQASMQTAWPHTAIVTTYQSVCKALWLKVWYVAGLHQLSTPIMGLSLTVSGQICATRGHNTYSIAWAWARSHTTFTHRAGVTELGVVILAVLITIIAPRKSIGYTDIQLKGSHHYFIDVQTT